MSIEHSNQSKSFLLRVSGQDLARAAKLKKQTESALSESEILRLALSKGIPLVEKFFAQPKAA